jgi:glutamyl-tRNA reductase
MRSQLVIIHRPRVNGLDRAFSLSSHWVEWETCIRRLAIGFGDGFGEICSQIEKSLHPEDVIYKGTQAYNFLLEVVCGLQSPVKGETEVHGQFREVLGKIGPHHQLFKVLQSAHVDARRVRASHLQGLGSQSYGSFARKQVRGLNEVFILGAGHLTRELLPWLTKLDIPVTLVVRDTKKHISFESEYETVRVLDFSESIQFGSGSALIIAAPVTSLEIFKWLSENDNQVEMVLDYRGESAHDPLLISARYFTLQDIFREIDSAKQKVDSGVEKARELIQSFSKSK